MENNHVISCRVNDKELSRVKNVAHNLNMKQSSVIKLALIDNLKKFKPIVLTGTEKRHIAQTRKDALDLLGKLSAKVNDLSSQWSHVGNNINQIAHVANSNGGAINKELQNSITNECNNLSKEKLDNQNDKLINVLIKIWKLLELPVKPAK